MPTKIDLNQKIHKQSKQESTYGADEVDESGVGLPVPRRRVDLDADGLVADLGDGGELGAWLGLDGDGDGGGRHQAEAGREASGGGGVGGGGRRWGPFEIGRAHV